MGKEIRVGLAVVGVLLILFCALLFGRLSQSGQGPPDVSIPVGEQGPAALTPPTTEPLRLHPTVIKNRPWDEVTSPARGNPTHVPPGASGPGPSVSPSSDNPRWHGEPKADPELSRPQGTVAAGAGYLPIPAPR